ncbi:uncharacterized protein [Nerophis lumbriciformis]|uniref:uncharacterized protein n=1 Tax=Nerophis lumbriciformis TaxID=546530 RepID=UPI003BA8F711
MAEAEKQQKKRKFLSEETKKRKRESTRIKGQSRINIGPAFNRWRALKDEEGFSTDAALALFLLDQYEKYEKDLLTSQRQSIAKAPHQPISPVVSDTQSERRHLNPITVQNKIHTPIFMVKEETEDEARAEIEVEV